jgi:hypothetical protein
MSVSEYSGRKIIVSVSCVTVRGEDEMETVRRIKTQEAIVWACVEKLKTFVSCFNLDTVGGILIRWLLHCTRLYEPKEL